MHRYKHSCHSRRVSCLGCWDVSSAYRFSTYGLKTQKFLQAYPTYRRWFKFTQALNRLNPETFGLKPVNLWKVSTVGNSNACLD